MINVDPNNKGTHDFSEMDEIPAQEELPRRLHKSKTNFYLFGVCGGIAEYFLVPPFFIRMVFLITMLFGGWGLILYIVAAFVIPAEEEITSGEKIPSEISRTKIDSHKLIGTLFLILGIYLLTEPFGFHRLINLFGIPHELILILFVIAAGIFLIMKRDFISESSLGEFHLIVTRPSSEKKFLGVCSGIANYMNIDVTFVRMLWIIASFLSLGIGIFIYIFFVILIPKEKEKIVEGN